MSGYIVSLNQFGLYYKYDLSSNNDFEKIVYGMSLIYFYQRRLIKVDKEL